MARLVYLGSPPAAVPALRALVDAGHEIVLVVSRADTRRGRGGATQPSAVKAAASELGIPVTDRLDEVLGSGAELGIVVAYGRIIPARVLVELSFLNIHFSLLPRWRGAAPVERAVLAGDQVTGVCIMRLEEGLDTGPVLARQAIDMDDDHAGVLVERLAEMGASLLVELLAAGVEALGPGEEQAGDPTYAAKLDPAEFRLDWQAPAEQLHRVVRTDHAFTTFRGRRLRVLEATPRAADAPGPAGALHGTAVTTGAGVLELVTVQPEGRTPMPAGAWRNGVHPADGELLGGHEADR